VCQGNDTLLDVIPNGGDYFKIFKGDSVASWDIANHTLASVNTIHLIFIALDGKFTGLKMFHIEDLIISNRWGNKAESCACVRTPEVGPNRLERILVIIQALDVKGFVRTG
jgi:hypothetical protein